MASILGDLDNFAYSIAVDYRLLTADEAADVVYGKVAYTAVKAVCVGTKVETVFTSGDFKTDFEQAMKFAEAKVADAVSAGDLAKQFQYIVINRDDTLTKFLELNTKYQLVSPARISLDF